MEVACRFTILVRIVMVLQFEHLRGEEGRVGISVLNHVQLVE